MLACAGVRVEGWFHCPHKPSDGCSCRKPAAGLAVEAQRKLGFDASDIAFVMGDKESDVKLAEALGAPSVLLMTGYGAAEYGRGVRGTLNCANIREAASVIARGEREGAGSGAANAKARAPPSAATSKSTPRLSARCASSRAISARPPR